MGRRAPRTLRQLSLPVHGEFTETAVDQDLCQRWRTRRHSWTPTSQGGFDPRVYVIAPITDVVGKDYVLRHHYSGTYPASSRHRYGLYITGADTPTADADGLDLVGVAIFGIPMQSRVLSGPLPDLEPIKQSLELSRFVLEGEDLSTGRPGRAPGNSETWFLARCMERLADDDVRAVVAFSDPVPRIIAGQTVFPGHHGRIYQASNAILNGRGTARTLTVLGDGTTLSDRAMAKVRARERGHEYVIRRLISLGARTPLTGENLTGWLADALHDVGATRLRHPGCWRYILPTSRRNRRRVRVAGTTLPYPK